MEIKQAEFVRFTERNDVRCADVEVRVEGKKEVYVVEFTASADEDFDMTHVYEKDASSEIDWYDNNLNKAYKDVSEELFENEAQEIKWGEREEFKQKILSYGMIRKELKEHFELLRKASVFYIKDVEEQPYLH